MTIPGPRKMGFEEWYANKFDWFVKQPMPLKIIYQAPIWLFYGFIWIPIWFVISDKTNRGPVDASNQMGDGSVPLPPVAQAETAPSTLSGLQTAATGSRAVDVNSASEAELSSIPGIGIALAKKAITFRSQNGGFSKLDQFYEVLGLKPHIVANLSERLTVSQATSTTPVGRVVDF